MNIYEALSTDHRTFESQLDTLLTQSRNDDPAWTDTLDQLRRGLIAHSHAEEALFYNALREDDSAKHLVAHSYTEHAAAEAEIRTLGLAKLVDKSWTSLAEKLAKDLRHHIQQEESEVYAAAQNVLSATEAEQLGAAFERLRDAMIPDGDSAIKSSLDLVANLLPPKLSQRFRQHEAQWLEQHGSR